MGGATMDIVGIINENATLFGNVMTAVSVMGFLV